ncbi:MAG: hypothetical protein S4CHLAM2_14760 [Chlamydiales bacterium]|nr:hypothetical protein [Chlamydiales bacterium]
MAGVIGGALSSGANYVYQSYHRWSVDTQNGLVYGADAWRIWGVEVLDEVPNAPGFEWDANDPFFDRPYRENYVLFYIPDQIREGGVAKELTLQTFYTICKEFTLMGYGVPEKYGHFKAPGWVLVSKKFVPVYEPQREVVDRINGEQKGFGRSLVLEAIVLVSFLAIYNRNFESCFGSEKHRIRCFERQEGRPEGVSYLVVGRCYRDRSTFFVSTDYPAFDMRNTVILPARRFFRLPADGGGGAAAQS